MESVVAIFSFSNGIQRVIWMSKAR